MNIHPFIVISLDFDMTCTRLRFVDQYLWVICIVVVVVVYGLAPNTAVIHFVNRLAFPTVEFPGYVRFYRLTAVGYGCH